MQPLRSNNDRLSGRGFVWLPVQGHRPPRSVFADLRVDHQVPDLHGVEPELFDVLGHSTQEVWQVIGPVVERVGEAQVAGGPALVGHPTSVGDDPSHWDTDDTARAMRQAGVVDIPAPSAPVFETLERARALTGAEMRAAQTLASAAGPELLAQLEGATVTGLCRCGCSSVQLATSSRPVTADWLSKRSPRGPEGHLAMTTVAEHAEDELVTVTLHVLHGRIAELEIFDAIRGEGCPVDLTALRLGPPTLE